MSEHATLAVRLDAGDSDAEELAELTGRLRRELLELDVDTVEHASGGAPPPGAKAVDVILIGTLIVTLAKSAGKLHEVVHTVQGWLGTRPARTVKLELDGDAIEITGASSDDQQRLIDLWIERHAEPT